MNKCLMASWNRVHFMAGRQSVAQVRRVGGRFAGGRPPQRVPGLWGNNRPRVKPTLTLSHQMLSYQKKTPHKGQSKQQLDFQN